MRWPSLWSLLLFFQIGAVSCSKEQDMRPYAFLQLRVYGSQDDVVWDQVLAKWNAGTGTFELDATGVQHDHCRIRMKDLRSSGLVASVTIENFFYTDGVTIIPIRLGEGLLEITKLSRHMLVGRFYFYLEDHYPQPGSILISGSFSLQYL